MNDGDPLLSFVFMLLFFIPLPFIAHKLAKEKGRNTVLWTVIACVPFLNFLALWYFVGAANLRLERKIDELLAKVTEHN